MSPSSETRNPLPRATLPKLAGRAAIAAGRVRLDPGDRAWVRSVLTPAELGLWVMQSDYDQRHAVRVARRVERRIARTVHSGDSVWLAAALMHDIGKLHSDLTMRERAIATLASRVVEVATARRWASGATGVKRRIGLYLIHGEVGARMIRMAGGREAVALWTEVHQGYRRVDGLGIPPVVVEALVESDVG